MGDRLRETFTPGASRSAIIDATTGIVELDILDPITQKSGCSGRSIAANEGKTLGGCHGRNEMLGLITGLLPGSCLLGILGVLLGFVGETFTPSFRLPIQGIRGVETIGVDSDIIDPDIREVTIARFDEAHRGNDARCAITQEIARKGLWRLG